jgi:hypothetical protein
MKAGLWAGLAPIGDGKCIPRHVCGDHPTPHVFSHMARAAIGGLLLTHYIQFGQRN